MEVEEPAGGQHGGRGIMGWLSGNRVFSRVVEKTKSSMETMITTLDPGMKEIISQYTLTSLHFMCFYLGLYS